MSCATTIRAAVFVTSLDQLCGFCNVFLMRSCPAAGRQHTSHGSAANDKSPKLDPLALAMRQTTKLAILRDIAQTQAFDRLGGPGCGRAALGRASGARKSRCFPRRSSPVEDVRKPCVLIPTPRTCDLARPRPRSSLVHRIITLAPVGVSCPVRHLKKVPTFPAPFARSDQR